MSSKAQPQRLQRADDKHERQQNCSGLPDLEVKVGPWTCKGTIADTYATIYFKAEFLTVMWHVTHSFFNSLSYPVHKGVHKEFCSVMESKGRKGQCLHNKKWERDPQ